MARRIRDVAYALECVVGPDQTDMSSLPMPDVPWSPRAERPRRAAEGRVVADARATRRSTSRCSRCCERAVRVLEALGTEVVEIPVVFEEDPIRHFLTIANVGTLVAVASVPRLTQRSSGSIPVSRSRSNGPRAKVTAVALKHAQDACHLLNLRLVEVFRGVSFLITPATAAVTPLARRGRRHQRHPDPELGAVHLSVQPDAFARGSGQRRLLRHGTSDRAAGDRAAARRRRRAPTARGCSRIISPTTDSLRSPEPWLSISGGWRSDCSSGPRRTTESTRARPGSRRCRVMPGLSFGFTVEHGEAARRARDASAAQGRASQGQHRCHPSGAVAAGAARGRRAGAADALVE